MVDGDPNDPRTWWRALVEAVAGLQRGDTSLATMYLQFVDKHRGRPVAVEAGRRLKRYAKSEAFRDCHLWPANGYRPPPRKKA